MGKKATMTLGTGSDLIVPHGPHVGAGVWGSFPSLHDLLRARAPRPRTAPPSARGFTLIEVLLSIAILSVGTVFVMQALLRGAYALAVADARTTVYAFASAKLSDLETGSAQGLAPKTSGKFTADGYPISWRLETSPLADEPELELATLTVSWMQGGQWHDTHFNTVRRLNPGEQL